MKRARSLAYAIMPMVFLCAMAPLIHYAYTKSAGQIFPTPEQQAFLNANPAKATTEVAQKEDKRPSRAKRPRLMVSISTANLVVHKCTDAAPEAVTTVLASTP